MSKAYSIISVDACAVGSAGGVIAGPIDISHFEHFSVTCITSATLAVAYSIQMSPFEDEGYATAGANFTATSCPAASGTDAVVSNKVVDNQHAWLQIQASALSATTKADVRFHIHGVRF